MSGGFFFLLSSENSSLCSFFWLFPSCFALLLSFCQNFFEWDKSRRPATGPLVPSPSRSPSLREPVALGSPDSNLSKALAHPIGVIPVQLIRAASVGAKRDR